MAFPILDAPYNLLDKVNETTFKGPTQHSISTSRTPRKHAGQLSENAPSPSFDPWLELQNKGHMLTPSTSNCTSWESFALNAADTLKMRSKPQLKSPFLSELSLDHFQRVEESYRQSTDHRYNPESLITHQYLIKDIITLLLGAPSNLFEFDVDKQSFVPRIPNIRTMGIGSKGLKSVIDRFISIGNQMARLDKIINTNKYRSGSSVAMAFVDCLADYHTYLQQSLLAMIERIGGIQKASIMELYYNMEDICYVLDELVKLCETTDVDGNSVTNSKARISDSNGELPNGAELLDIIFKKVKSLDTAQCGCTYLLRSILSAFLTTSSTPYFTLILGWLGIQPGEQNEHRTQQTLIYDQSLQSIDPHHEFFVQATNHVSSSFTQDYSVSQSNMSSIPGMFHSNTAIQDGDQYWYSSFQLQDSLRPCFISDELALDILETGKSLRLLKNLFPVDGPSLNDYIKHFIVQDDSKYVLPTWKFIIFNESQHAKANGCTISTDGPSSTTFTLDIDVFGNSNQVTTTREKHACDDSFILPSPKRQRHNTQATSDTLKPPFAQELSLPEITNPPTSAFIKLLEDFQICGFTEQHEAEEAAHMPPLDAVTATSVEQPLSRLCRSLNTSVMAYFFKNLQLLQYLQALQDYFTFKNGDFYSNAMDALFRSDLDEDQPGGLVTIGLPKSIKSRKWPPSSIDLNIALKDVLLNSSSNLDDLGSNVANHKLSVGRYISFSVRQNMESGAKWTNPQSLEAVDFLQLSYSPPYPLNIIITPTIIEKYNRVFSFLLRLFRVRLVVQNMHKCMQARRGMSKTKTNAYLFIEPVRFQFAHFVEALHGYVMDAVITSNWKAYMRHLEAMAKEATTQTNNDQHSSSDATDNDLTETIKLMMDLDTLRTYNEYFVELLLHQCILKRKQQGILRIIETLLGCVLALAALISDFDTVCYDNREPTENEIRKLHRHCTKIQNRFHSQMKTLVAILASLQARDSGDIRFSVDQRRLSKLEVFAKYYEKVASADGAVNCYERLLLRLDFNGYYQDVQ
ncbi:hypothetical protein K450DRAFT_130890 [Umbelopsis ramanniana AG]|uniref:Spindle pole body component n=1 Tax=Umbelopsis ramanniana AG TaxID=1314678 RepID=A0AAD5E427_UMBRA|nr:uncharacterized protein K450DRAFT_130890 [Umbelopsis ramanniana AG]KAI8576101.1 hypothetical protein K450DRAFT_130890 [Umbelopsis ramanniana AG]